MRAHFLSSSVLAGCLPLCLTALLSSASAQIVTPPSVHGMLSSYTGAETCLMCHALKDVDKHVMGSVHWTWIHTNTAGGVTQVLGKQNMVNNYCIALASNEPRCTSCHVGVGWKDKSFNFNDRTRIDCLVCHDTTGTYKKTPTGAGAPDPGVNLLLVAQKAGRSSRATCGACHFYGGGDDAVKHGDLDSTMKNPTRNVDVHMGTDGLNQSCTFCHASTEPGANDHQLVGTRYSKPAPDNWLCEKCHDPNTRHQNTATRARLESHVSRVACQSCHIPAFARGGKATKMNWDWSTAGQKNANGSDKVVKDAKGNTVYDTKKGTFVWEENVVPEYRWFNGQILHATLDDEINPETRVSMTRLFGDINDPNARIVPVKRFTGTQPYDLVNERFVVPHLFPLNATDTAAYWKGYNWTNAIAAGMAYTERSFSGQIGWVDTEMFWIQNHMVAPKEQAVSCSECHVPGGRMNFAALGYPEERAMALQTMAGFDVTLEREAAGVILTWTATPGNVYQVQRSTNPANPSGWSDAENGRFPGGASPGKAQWTDAVQNGAGTMYYRVVRSRQ